MTYGRQNSEIDGHQQLDYALDHGVNFIDTAEMYPVPAEATRYGNTERIIGTWIKKSRKRNDIVLATKIAYIAVLPIKIAIFNFFQNSR